jgi:DNA-directed RNA polymerase subunit RPC12/RpoP
MLSGYCAKCGHTINIEESYSSVICPKCNTRVYLTEIRNQNKPTGDENNKMGVADTVISAIIAAPDMPAIGFGLGFLAYFFWKLKTKKWTIVRLFTFSFICLSTVTYSIQGIQGIILNFPPIAVWVCFAVGTLSLVRVIFDIIALKKNKFTLTKKRQA